MSHLQRKQAMKRRTSLFKRDRPNLRDFTEDDLGILWAQHKATAEETLSADEFNISIRQALSRYDGVMLVEDKNKAYPEGYGPVGFLGLMTDGWKAEPDLEFFKWATPRNILRSSVAIFRWFQTNRDVGVCFVKSSDKAAILMRKMKKYGVLFPISKIPYGRPDGNEHLFYVKGKRDGTT